MPDQSHSPLSGLSRALGRIPSGLFVLTVRHGAHASGMLASWVQQAGFDPPMVTVAIQRDRFLNDWIDATGRCTLNQLATGSKSLIRHFSRGFAPEAPAFEGLALHDAVSGGPVLAAALSYLDLEVVGAMLGGDHRVLLAKVVAADQIEPNGEPFIHVRANGFHY